MYIIKIYNNDFSTPALTTLLFGDDFYDLSYEKEINKSGGSKFKIATANSKATPANLRMFNRIEIYKNGTIKFLGYIENLNVGLNEIEVECPGLLGFFKKRLTSGTFTAQTITAVLTSILNATNSLGATGVTMGTVELGDTVNDVEFTRSTIYDAFIKLANLYEGELEIDTLHRLNLRSRLGTDKTATLFLRYEQDRINMATILDFEADVEGKDMANRVIGVGDGIESTQTDTTSAAAFGYLEETENFSDTASQTDLDSETSAYVAQHAPEFYSPKIRLNPKKIGEEDIELGDTVSLILKKGFIDLSRLDRIIKKKVILKENGEENVTVELLPEGTNILPSTFITGIVDLARRVSLLESTL